MSKPLSIAGEWERLLQGGEPDHSAVRTEIRQSWLRSLSLGVAPGGQPPMSMIDGPALEVLARRRADLTDVARSVMAQSLDFLTETGSLMVLADSEGIVLSVEGPPALLERARSIGLTRGGAWSEASAGTTGIGTALALGRAIQVRTQEHFHYSIKDWTCSAGVIHDPVDGQLLGVLVVCGVDGSHSGHCLALATAEASRIELNLARGDAEHRARLLALALGDPRRWMDSGLVIFDRRGKLLHANRHATRFLEERDLPPDFWRSTAIQRLASGEEQSSAAPDWLKKEWLEPVTDRDHVLGSVLSLPTTQRTGAHRGGSDLAGIIGRSAAIVDAKARAGRLAKLQLPILLLGPTGTGKEVFAAAIHKAGGMSGPFLPINCGALARDLLASELFGHADGAFTGARRGGMAGKFEAADGGTLFLDEIGEMPLELQAHLLRVLEDGIVYRLGEAKPRQVKVRIIAATHRDLKAEAQAGRFRMDLYYRLSVAQITLPPLAERRDDIPPLIDHFVQQASRKHDLPVKQLGPGVLEALNNHDWPGNARELRNVVESMLALSPGPDITLADLPSDIGRQAERGCGGRSSGALRTAEVDALRAAVRAENGNLTRASARLGIARSTLYEKLKRHGLDREGT